MGSAGSVSTSVTSPRSPCSRDQWGALGTVIMSGIAPNRQSSTVPGTNNHRVENLTSSHYFLGTAKEVTIPRPLEVKPSPQPRQHRRVQQKHGSRLTGVFRRSG